VSKLSKLRPLHDRLLVRRIEEDETAKGGIIIPDSAKEKPQKGEVLAAGNGKILENGTKVALDVKVGDMVAKGQPLGRSGMTGLAGGDHVHFTMLVGGEQVTPVDWWSAQWMQDRVLRKIAAAGGV